MSVLVDPPGDRGFEKLADLDSHDWPDAVGVTDVESSCFVDIEEVRGME